MKHGKGEKEEREGKRRRGGEKGGRKGDFKANRPLLMFRWVRRARMRARARPRDLAPACRVESRGEAEAFHTT